MNPEVATDYEGEVLAKFLGAKMKEPHPSLIVFGIILTACMIAATWSIVFKRQTCPCKSTPACECAEKAKESKPVLPLVSPNK